MLHGTPIHQTEIGRDPTSPVRESHLVRLLERETHHPVGLLDMATVAQGPAAIRQAADRLSARGVRIVVCDVEDDAGLSSIASSLADRTDVLWAGSAGLAEHLAEALGLRRSGRRDPAPQHGRNGPILLIAGSVSETTRRQVSAVRNHRRVVAVEIDAARLMAAPEQGNAEVVQC